MRKLPLLLITFCLISTYSFAQQQVSFAWDLSASDSLMAPSGGYHLYQSKTSNTYSLPAVATVGVGVSTVTITVNALGRFYWVVTAFDSEGNESSYSNEVSLVIKPKPPKLNTVQQVAEAIKSVVTKVASLFSSRKQLRITN